MRNPWVAAAAVCTLAGTVASTASAAPSDRTAHVRSGPEVRPLRCENGRIHFGWDGATYDWTDFVTLTRGRPDPDSTANRVAFRYVTSEDGTAVRHSFDSELQSGTGLWTAYWTYDVDLNRNVIVSEAGPEDKLCT
ncbi:hypothetical protein DR950_31770 [Kitasatospora xanthocidica]|uniref:Secreted protein n=1 Tax=Kitasatospora xanthocidica TaxID=83382 RepID=A0A373A2Q5_9ACTN|nr:hypothetical protein [Kitasatospora xanthocidica]RGD61715.1 hypothetical protein DR950_31770 [Kitasatospora xanthocidica]